MARDHISIGCQGADKERYRRLAARMGYTNFSEFVTKVLDAMAERYETEEWESHLVYVSGANIVGFGRQSPSVAPFATPAFQLAAPGLFWRHLERVSAGLEEDAGSGSAE